MTEQRANPPDDRDSSSNLDVVFGDDDGGASEESSNDQVAALQDRVTEIENKLHEERFIWIIVVVIMFDAMLLLQANNWSAPIVIGLLQLIALVILAQKCRVDPVMPLIDRVTGMIGNGSAGPRP